MNHEDAWMAGLIKADGFTTTIGVQTNNGKSVILHVSLTTNFMKIGQRNKWKTMTFGECHDGMCAQVARTNAQVNVSVIPRSRVTWSEHMRLNQRNWKLPKCFWLYVLMLDQQSHRNFGGKCDCKRLRQRPGQLRIPTSGWNRRMRAHWVARDRRSVIAYKFIILEFKINN